MNQLLANYDAALKAVYDHCGVVDKQRNLPVTTEPRPWYIDMDRRRLVIPDLDKGDGYWQFMHDVESDSPEYGKSIYRGEQVTLCLLNFGDEYPEEEWFALDNVLEVKP